MMRRLNAAILLVSVSILGFEVSLLQVLSFAQWYHFASMIISIALLGFGISGTLISLKREWFLERFESVTPRLLVLTSGSMAVAVPLSQIPPFRFDSYLLFVEGGQFVSLLLSYLVLTVPFVFGSMVIGLCFVRHTPRVGSLYFANLTGSGVGAILAVVLMWWFDATAASACFAFLAVLAAILTTRSGSRILRVSASMVGLLCVVLVILPAEIKPSQFKDVSRATDLPDARIIATQPSPFGVVQVVRSGAARHAPGLSLRFDGVVEPRDLVFVNGDAAGTIGGSVVGDTIHIYDFTTRALPYLASAPDSMGDSRHLILGDLPEEAVSQALGHGATAVTAVASNSVLTSMARHRPESPLNHQSVQTVNARPRSFLSRERRRYTQILLPDAGRFGGSVGLEETEENFLMTTEALDRMWDLLDENGTISVTAWMDYPYRYPLRVAVLFTDLLRRRGLSPELHLAAIRSWTDVTFSISRYALDETGSARIRGFSRRMGFDPLLLPELLPGERDRFNQLQDQTLFEKIDAIMAKGFDQFVTSYGFHMDPPTDDKPYFSRFVRWRSLSALRNQFGDSTTPFFGLGLFIAAVTFLQALILSVVLIVVPIAAVRPVRHQSVGTLLYFASLGLGFMFVEIVLIQRFTLYLGDPVYAVSTVLGIVLIGSGIGALHSSRLPARQRTVARTAATVTVLGLAYLVVLTPFFDATISLSQSVRMTIAAMVLFPIAYAMGHPFPMGLRMISERTPAQVPWAWGVNGCLSVIGASAAPLISIEWGFTTLFAAGCVSYGLAAVTALVRSSPQQWTAG